MIRLGYIAAVLGLCATACSFQPSGGATEGDAAGDDVDGAAIDAPVSTDGRPAIDAPMVSIDAAIDAATPTEGVVRAPPLSAAGDLDGVATEFATAMRYSLDLGGAGHRDLVAGYTPSMRAELRAAHDATHLYLFVDVFEVEPHSGDSTQTWQNDAVTFYLDLDDDRSGPFGDDDHEVIIDYRPVYGVYPSDNGIDPTIEAVRLNTAEGFTVEARIPRSELGSPSNGGRIGFDWGIYDDDGGGNAEGYGLWYERPAVRCATCCTGENHAEAWCDSTLLGELTFSP